jgi:hypothetical protein
MGLWAISRSCAQSLQIQNLQHPEGWVIYFVPGSSPSWPAKRTPPSKSTSMFTRFAYSHIRTSDLSFLSSCPPEHKKIIIFGRTFILYKSDFHAKRYPDPDPLVIQCFASILLRHMNIQDLLSQFAHLFKYFELK